MTQKQKKGRQTGADRTVCFCYNVAEGVIADAIVNGGCRTLMDIRRDTFASSGCAGCSEEVKKILRKMVDQETGELVSADLAKPSSTPNDPQGSNEE